MGLAICVARSWRSPTMAKSVRVPPGRWNIRFRSPTAALTTATISSLRACRAIGARPRMQSSQAVRARNGLTRTPLSRERRDDAQARNTLIGIGTVAAAGGFIAGPVGIAIGALVGGLVGNSIDPE